MFEHIITIDIRSELVFLPAAVVLTIRVEASPVAVDDVAAGDVVSLTVVVAKQPS